MPLRDILVTVVILGLLPICFLKPWIGVLVWSWIGYMNPHRLAYGEARYAIPFAFLVAIAVLVGAFFTKDRSPLPWFRETILLLLLWATFFVSTLFAAYPQDAWDQLDRVSKILLMTFMTPFLLQDRKKLKMLLWVIALSIGFYGVKGGIWGVLTGGQNMVLGPPGSFIEGNTEIGLALNMVLPIFHFLRRETERPWLKHLLLAMFLFCVIAIVITYSRGAFLGLAAVLSILFLKSRGKVIFLLLLCVGVSLAITSLPEKWFEKMQTIETYEEDASAMGRLVAWQMAWRLALDRPLVGAGFRSFTPEMYRRYLPGSWASRTDAHSIFFQVLAEHGFTGLTIYIMLILSSFLSLRQLIRRFRGNPAHQWIVNSSTMLEASLLGFVVNGLFLSLSYFDLFFHLIAIVIILRKLALVEERKSQLGHEEIGRALVSSP